MIKTKYWFIVNFHMFIIDLKTLVVHVRTSILISFGKMNLAVVVGPVVINCISLFNNTFCISKRVCAFNSGGSRFIVEAMLRPKK